MIINKINSGKIIILLLLIFSVKNASFAQNDSLFSIKGKINGLINDQWIWLQNADEDQSLIDSVKTINGEFNFVGRVNNPTLYRLNIGKSTRESFPFFVENANISLKCEYIYPFSCEVKGSYNQHLVDEFAVREKMAWNPEVIENLKNTYVNFNEKAGQIRKQTFSETIKSFGLLHPSDRAIAYLTSVNSNYILDNDLTTIYNSFGENLKKSIFSKEINAEIDLRNSTRIGRKLVDIKQNDLNGEKVSLWDFREKYVLLYFWASGFEPARKENAKLLKLYDKYKDWGFEVMAVSLDSLENDWTRAVLEDNLNWQNVSDLQGWDNAIARKLNVQAVPYTILLDREGAIIGKDLRAEELDNILNLIKATRDAAGQKYTKKAVKSKRLFARKRRSKSGSLPGAGI
jgi:peroxiredoxin/Ca2+-binding EF-hand superfamily protein